MPLRDTVRDAQRKLAELDTACRRATTKLDHAAARRAAVLANQDRLVQLARDEVDRTVVAMAAEIGADLTASLVNLDAADVRRLVKTRRRVDQTRSVAVAPTGSRLTGTSPRH